MSSKKLFIMIVISSAQMPANEARLLTLDEQYQIFESSNMIRERAQKHSNYFHRYPFLKRGLRNGFQRREYGSKEFQIGEDHFHNEHWRPNAMVTRFAPPTEMAPAEDKSGIRTLMIVLIGLFVAALLKKVVFSLTILPLMFLQVALLYKLKVLSLLNILVLGKIFSKNTLVTKLAAFLPWLSNFANNNNNGNGGGTNNNINANVNTNINNPGNGNNGNNGNNGAAATANELTIDDFLA